MGLLQIWQLNFFSGIFLETFSETFGAPIFLNSSVAVCDISFNFLSSSTASLLTANAIPFIPLYFVLLMKVMKAKGVHEDCIQQIHRLFAKNLFTGKPLDQIPVDNEGRVRIDDLEMREDVQKEVMALWKNVSTENVQKIADVKGYNDDFLRLFGFGLDGVDYSADVEIDLNFENPA